jgi:hypothetical protein
MEILEIGDDAGAISLAGHNAVCDLFGEPCCRCVSSGTLLCWTLVLREQFTRRMGSNCRFGW